MTEFVSYSKSILDVLSKTEDKINEMISSIEKVINSGNKNDKELMLKLILNKKNINKREKQLLFQRLEEELKLKEKLKIIERGKKLIMKRKKVAYDYPTNKKFKYHIKKIQEIKNDDNISIHYEYSFSEEEEEQNK